MKNKFNIEVIKKLANLDKSAEFRECTILEYLDSCKIDLPYFNKILAKTHSTLQKDINRMRKLTTNVSNAMVMRKFQLIQMNDLITKLLKEERITKEELKKYILSNKKAKEKFNQNDSKKNVDVIIEPEKVKKILK